MLPVAPSGRETFRTDFLFFRSETPSRIRNRPVGVVRRWGVNHLTGHVPVNAGALNVANADAAYTSTLYRSPVDVDAARVRRSTGRCLTLKTRAGRQRP